MAKMNNEIFGTPFGTIKAAARSRSVTANSYSMPSLMFVGLNDDSGADIAHLAFLSSMRAKKKRVQTFYMAGNYKMELWQAYVSGRKSYMLDEIIYTKDSINYLLAQHRENCDMFSISSSAGLYDGLYPDELKPVVANAFLGKDFTTLAKENVEEKATTNLAKGSALSLALSLSFPVILVLRPNGGRQNLLAQLAAILPRKNTQYSESEQSQFHIKGIILNNVDELNYEKIKKRILAEYDVEMLGFIPNLEENMLDFNYKNIDLNASETDEFLSDITYAINEATRTSLDLEAILKISKTSKPFVYGTSENFLKYHRQAGEIQGLRLAVAIDSCFNFYNADNLNLLKELGIKIIPFSPLQDYALPDVDGLLLGGIYSTDKLKKLARNTRLMSELRRKIRNENLPVWAEGQGAAYLAKYLECRNKTRYPLCHVEDYVILEPKENARDREFSLELIPNSSSFSDSFVSTNIPIKLKPKANSLASELWVNPYEQVKSLSQGLLLPLSKKYWTVSEEDFVATNSTVSSGFQLVSADRKAFNIGISTKTKHILKNHVYLYSDITMAINFMKAMDAYRRS